MSVKRIALLQSYELFPDFRVFKELEVLKRTGALLEAVLWQRTEDGRYIKGMPGVSVHKIKLNARHGMGLAGHMIKQPRFFLECFRTLRRLKPDIVIAHNLDAAMPAVFYRLLSGFTPVIYVSREPYHKVLRMKADSFVFEAAGWLADAVTARLSSAVAAVTPMMVRMYASMGVKARWIPNCPSMKIFNEAGKKIRKEDGVTLGFVGTLRRYCGIEEAWEAVKKLNTEGKGRYKLLLCGMPLGGFESVLESMAKEAPQWLDIREPVTPDRIADIYRVIDIAFQFPEPNKKYKKYGLNVKIFEAMASGTPVIIGNTSENPGFLKDKGAAEIISDRSPEAISAAVTKIASDSSLYESMSVNGRRFIENEFNWDIYGQKYLDMVKRYL